MNTTLKIDLKNDNNISSMVDIIRGIAILLVIIIHVRNFVGQTGGLDYVFDNNYGWLVELFSFGGAGVALFFMISGFLMDYLYKDSLNIKQFAVKRIARIFPAWLLWHSIGLLFAIFALSWTFDGGKNIMSNIYGGIEPFSSLENILLFFMSLMFLGFLNQNIWNTYIPGGWSIQAEVTHYSIFPFINKTSTSYILSFSLMLQAVGLLISFNEPVHPIILSFITSPFWFFMGIVISRIIRNNKNGKTLMSPLEIILILSNFVLTYTVQGPFVSQSLSIITVVYSLFIAILIFNSQFLSKLVKAIGKYSYGMYFNHFLIGVPIGFLASTIINNYKLGSFTFLVVAVAFLITTALSFFLGKVIYELYEKKFIVKANSMFKK